MNGDARPISETTSNLVLGALLLALGAAVLVGYAGGLRDFASAEFYPALVALGMLACGAALIAFAHFGGHIAPVRWTWLQLAAVTIVTAAILIALGFYFVGQFLRFGPPEYAAIILMTNALALALARRSHLRALGMMLIGLLLATVGIDAATGRMRFTFGSEILFDGFDWLVLAPGLILVADGLICVVSPSRWLSTFTWLAGEWQQRGVSAVWAIALRVAAAAVIAACVWLAYNVHFRSWDIILLALAAAFGIAAKFLGWNRAVLLVAFYQGAQLEQSLRNSLFLGNGSPLVLFERPYSLLHTLAAVALIVFTLALWLWRVRRAKA